MKLCVKMHFLQDPLKAYILYLNNFIYVLPKKTRNKHLLATHDYYFLFKTFFSQVNNKGYFWGDPSLKVIFIINIIDNYHKKFNSL